MTMANSKVASSPSSLQSPRALANATSVSNSILDAALRLTNLGTPSPPSCKVSSPRTSGSVSNTPSFKDASEARPAAQDVYKPLFMDSSIYNAAPVLNHDLKKSMAALYMPPTSHYLENLPSYPIEAAAQWTTRPSLEYYSSPWSSMIHPGQSAAGFDSLGLSDAATAMDRNLASMYQAAKLTNAPANPGYSYHCHLPSYAPQENVTSVHLPPKNVPTETSMKSFPELLFDVISDEENTHILAWLPHGRGFIIHDKKRFADIILKRYFEGAKFTSFTRRIKRWGFARVSRGAERGAYYHETFKRDRMDLVQEMQYHIEGIQFESKKKMMKNGSGKDKHDGDEQMEDQKKKLEDQIENKVEAKTIESFPKKEQAPMNESLRPHKQSQEYQGLPNRQPILQSRTPGTKTDPEIQKNFADPQESPKPLPGVLPQMTKKTGAGMHPLKTNLTNEERGGPSEGRTAATLIHQLSQENQIEMQRELLLAPSPAFRDGASGRSTEDGTLGLAASDFLRPNGSNNMSGLEPSAQSTTSPRMINVEHAKCAKRMIEAERNPSVLRHGQFVNSKNGHDLELATKVSLESSSSGDGGVRAVMMTREEEVGFSRHLHMKKISGGFTA